MMYDSRTNAGEELRTAHEILDCLESDGPLSRAAVAKKLGLSRTTLTNLVGRLIDKALVREVTGNDDARGRGRPGIPIDLDASRWRALGAVFNSERWVFAVTTIKGDVVFTHSEPSSSRDAGVFLSSLTKGIGVVRKKFAGALLPGVGIGAPGLVDWERGVILRADDLGWTEIAVREAVEKACGFTAFVINRNRAAGVAEARYGRGKGCDSFIYIGVGTGISAAIMLGGELLHGVSHSAGEIGHVVTDPRGPRCRCGKRGCLQTLAAEPGLVDRATSLFKAGRIGAKTAVARGIASGAGVKGEDVFADAVEGDEGAESCVRYAAFHLGMVIGNLITTFNPGKVILGGPLIRNAPAFADYVRREAAKWAMEHPLAAVTVEASGLDESAGARGAACLVLRNKLELVDAG